MDTVYVLTNQAMPGLIKVGITGAEDVETRMKSLGQSGVPLPFECYYAAEVEDAQSVEKAMHAAFDELRVRRGREFFELDPNKAKVIIELLAVRDVTPRDDVVSSVDDTEADTEALTKRKGRIGFFRFSQAEVPVGATLTFSRDEGQTATVLDGRTIKFREHQTSLGNSATDIMRDLGFNGERYHGTTLWLYDGRSLNERRREVEERASEAEELTLHGRRMITRPHTAKYLSHPGQVWNRFCRLLSNAEAGGCLDKCDLNASKYL